MQGQNSKSTFWGDLWEIAKDAYKVVTGEPALSTPEPVTATLPVVQKVVDLVESDDDDEEENEEDILDTTPEEAQLAFDAARQQTILAFQYLRKLDIAENEKPQATLVKIRNKKLPFKVQSKAYNTYQDEEKKSEFQKLIALIPIIGKDGADIIINGEWFRDEEVNHFLELLTLRDPTLYYISSLNVAHNDFCDRLQNRASYAKQAQAMREANRIMFAVNKDKHWHLVTIEKQANNQYVIACLDSLGYNDNVVAKKAVNILNALYAKEDVKPTVSKPRFITVPKQHNLDDCGVSVCYWANEIVEKQALPADQNGGCDYSQYRYEIADIFVKAYAKELKKPIVIEDDAPTPTAPKSYNILDEWKRKNKM